METNGAAALRHDTHTAHIPVIVLSGRIDDRTLAGAYTAGANAYLAKPPDMQALLSLVERFAALKIRDVAA